MPSIEKTIQFMQDHKKGVSNVRYSMGSDRFLNPNLDCSSAVYFALKAGGFIPQSIPIGNTETLYQLNGKIFTEIYDISEVKRGDIFILGEQGRSYGAGGHTGIFLGHGKIIHCNYRNNGITIDNVNSVLSRKRSYKERYFRLKQNNKTENKSNYNQVTSKAKFIKNERGKATFLATTNIRTAPSVKTGKITGRYYPKMHLIYRRVFENEGYRWCEYMTYKGELRYFAYRTTTKPIKQWVTFS